MKIKITLLTLIAILISSAVGCVYLKGSMKTRVYPFYDPAKYSLEESAKLTVSARSKLYSIDGLSVAQDFFNSLRYTEYQLDPGYHKLFFRTVVDTNHMNKVGTLTTTERRSMAVVMQKGKRYQHHFDLKSAASRFSWIEDEETKEFITGYREVVQGSAANPPFSVKSWQGSCSKDKCSHVYTERTCKTVSSCVIKKQNCIQGKGCTDGGTTSY